MKSAVFLLIFALAAPAFGKMHLPKSAAQGQFLAVTLDGAPALANLSASFAGKETPCYADPLEAAKWHCLIALPANAETGLQKIELRSEEKEIGAGSVKIVKTKFPVEELRLSKSKKDLVEKGDSEEEKLKIRAALGSETSEKFWDGPFAMPVKGPIESHYGLRRTIDGKLRPNYYHRGTDIAAPSGTPMKAPQSGKIVLAGPFTEEGNMVMIDHGHGVVSAYLHCSKILVEEGQSVKKGQEIALVGTTGVVNSPHLHLGLYIHGTPIDALFWINRKLPY